MPKLSEVVQHVRSKNAGPFWVTIDIFFVSRSVFDAFVEDPALGPEAIATLYEVDAASIKRVPMPALNVLKISYPRSHPQGWAGERDMHQGQSFARLLNIELASG